VSNTNGSARVSVGGTAVLVGVKLVTAEPDPAAPSQGKIEVMVDCSAGASPAFVSRGGDDLSHSLASALRRLAGGQGVLNLDGLCIIPGQRVWQIHVDALVLECSGGNLYDCCVSRIIVDLVSHFCLFRARVDGWVNRSMRGGMLGARACVRLSFNAAQFATSSPIIGSQFCASFSRQHTRNALPLDQMLYSKQVLTLHTTQRTAVGSNTVQQASPNLAYNATHCRWIKYYTASKS
jgi:hypothetical protein